MALFIFFLYSLCTVPGHPNIGAQEDGQAGTGAGEGEAESGGLQEGTSLPEPKADRRKETTTAGEKCVYLLAANCNTRSLLLLLQGSHTFFPMIFQNFSRTFPEYLTQFPGPYLIIISAMTSLIPMLVFTPSTLAT